MTVKAVQAAAQPVATWTVRPGDTLSAIATALSVRGGWQALYAANRRLIGPDPGLIRPGTILTLPGRPTTARYAVAPGDTLSAIAAALGVRGGWQALYAANRRVIGPDPGLIRPGTVLTVPGMAAAKVPAATATGPGGHQALPPSAPPASGRKPAASPPTAPGATAAATPSGTVPAGSTPSAGVMPGWLKVTLLAVGMLAVISFIAQPAVAISQRRRRAAKAHAAERDRQQAEHEREQAEYEREQAEYEREQAEHERERGQRAAEKAARIVEADYERLIVTYCVSDDTVYLLTPPGEDPRAVLRAARLVLPEDTYQELAGHLGVAPGWKLE